MLNHSLLYTPSPRILHNFDSTGIISGLFYQMRSGLFRVLQLYMRWFIRLSHTNDYSNYIQDRYGRPNSRQHLLGLSKVGSTFCSVQVGPVDTFHYWKLSLYLRIRLKGRKLRYLKEWIPFSWVEILDLHIPGFTHILFKYLNS